VCVCVCVCVCVFSIRNSVFGVQGIRCGILLSVFHGACVSATVGHNCEPYKNYSGESKEPCITTTDVLSKEPCISWDQNP